MARKTLHDSIVNILVELNVKEWGDYYSNFNMYLPGTRRKPLPIARAVGRKILTLPYYPDVWGESSSGQIDVFEVWDTEDITNAIEDVVLSALVKSIRYLTIICTGRKITKQKANEICKLILNFMRNEKGKRLVKKWHVIEIPKQIWSQRNEIYERLKKSSWMQY